MDLEYCLINEAISMYKTQFWNALIRFCASMGMYESGVPCFQQVSSSGGLEYPGSHYCVSERDSTRQSKYSSSQVCTGTGFPGLFLRIPPPLVSLLHPRSIHTNT